MDIQALLAAQQETSTRRNQHQQVYAEHYDQALALIQRFNQQQCFYKPYLQEAVEHLLKALQYQRNQPEPYLWLTYAMQVFSQPRLACQYLAVARSLEPQHPLLQALMAALQAPKTRREANGFQLCNF